MTADQNVDTFNTPIGESNINQILLSSDGKLCEGGSLHILRYQVADLVVDTLYCLYPISERMLYFFHFCDHVC